MKATITLDYEEFEHLKDLENELFTKLREELKQADEFRKNLKEEGKIVKEVSTIYGTKLFFYNDLEKFFEIEKLQEELKQKIKEASEKDDINNYRIIGFKIRKRG